MKNEEVPMHYIINKLSFEAQEFFKILYLIYGASAIVFISYVLHKRPRIWKY